MVHLEIELLGKNANDEVYELRNFLRERIEQANLAIKKEPAGPGQMSDGNMQSIITGVLESAGGILVESLYSGIILPLIKEWLASRKAKKAPALEIMSTLKTNDEKIHFLEDSSGNSQVFNFRYNINTEKTRVLLIGVGKFTNAFNPIPPITGNLDSFYKLLSDKRHVGIPKENIIVSQDESHTSIQRHMLQISRIPDTETLIIYFAGHGHRADVKKLLLIAADTEKIGDDIIGGIEFDFVSSKILKASTARQKILILDTCHSGIATQGDDDATMGFDVKGTYVLTSSPGDNVSYFAKDTQHTYFTGALIDVLKNGIDNSSEMLALEDFYDYTKTFLSEKKLPEPHVKSELNIPPANFFIARNPSFSSERLKWKATNLFKEGKLEEAVDEFRLLLKRYPADEQIRKQFEECEAELSFSRLVNEANSSFYEQKDYSKAVNLYRRAYQLKKDSIVMEKIRQSEQMQAGRLGLESLQQIKGDDNFKRFQQYFAGGGYYTAGIFLAKAAKLFPDNSYLKDQAQQLEKKLNELGNLRSDERLNGYFANLDTGNLQQALVQIKIAIEKDPEYPAFQNLQRELEIKLKGPTQQTWLKSFFNTKRIAGTAAAFVLATLLYYFLPSHKNNISGLRSMLISDPVKALGTLKEMADDNDSAKLLLGDYFKNNNNFTEAASWYEKAELPAAKSYLGAMYYAKKFGNSSNNGKEYFEAALRLKKDTLANIYLGFFATEKLPFRSKTVTWDSYSVEPAWKEAISQLEEGYAGSSINCKDQLGKLYYERGKYLRYGTPPKNDDAYGYFLKSAGYNHSYSMYELGGLFEDSLWRNHNQDSCEFWFKNSARLNNANGLNEYARLLMNKSSIDKAYYDTAHNLLMRANQIDPELGPVYTNLGTIYEYGGKRIHADSVLAIHYYKMAAERKRPMAINALKRLKVPGY